MMRGTQNLPDDLCRPTGFLGDLVQHLDETAEYSCPEFFLAAALCLLSTICGRKVQDYRGTRPNLFAVSIGPSGAGKDHSRKALRKILADTLLEGPEKFTSGSAIVSALVESPSLLCQIDEVGLYLRAACSDRAPAHLAAVVSGLMTAYTSPDSIWRPTGFADSKNTLAIDQPNIVVHGTTTSASFFDGMTGSQVASGFIGRLLIFLSPGGGYAPQKSFEICPIPESIFRFVHMWLNRPYGPGNLAGEHPDPPRIDVTEEAHERLSGHFKAISERRIDEDETAAAMWSRTSEKSSKLALLAAVSRQSEVIELSDANWAVETANFLTRRMITLVRGNVATTDYERKVQRILRLVSEAGGVCSMAELGRRAQWLSLRERGDILKQLTGCGLLIYGIRDSKGRPAHAVGTSAEALTRQRWIVVTPELIEELRKPPAVERGNT